MTIWIGPCSLNDTAIDVAPSKCPPVEYGNEKFNGAWFAMDDAAIDYWLDPDCEVWRTKKDGTGVSIVAQAPDVEIAVDDLHVYWTSSAGHLMNQLKNGKPGSTLQYATFSTGASRSTRRTSTGPRTTRARSTSSARTKAEPTRR